MSEVSPKPAKSVSGGGGRGGDGDGPSLTKILVIIGALVLLITTIIVLLWDPSNVCERLQRGEILAMGATSDNYFHAIDTTFRGLYVPYAALKVEQMPRSARVDMLGVSWQINLEEWAATSLATTPGEHFSTGFLFEHDHGTMVGVISDDRQKVAISVLREATYDGHATSHPYSVTPIALQHLPSDAVLITYNALNQRSSDVAYYEPATGILSHINVERLLNSANERIFDTVRFPAGLSLNGGYRRPGSKEIIAWSRKSGCILLLNSTNDAVELPYDQFFDCKLPGGLGSFLLKMIIIGGTFLLILIIVGVLLACKALFTKKRGRGSRKSQQMSGKSGMAPGSTAGQSTANSPGEANQIKMAPSIASKLGQGKSVRKLSTSWSRTGSSAGSSATGDTASTLSTFSSANGSKTSKASTMSSVGNTSSVNTSKATASSAVGGSSFGGSSGYGRSNMASTVSAAGSSSAIGGSSAANTSSFSKAVLGSSAVSSNAGGSAAVSSNVGGSSVAGSKAGGASKAAPTPKPATPSQKAGASKTSVAPASKFAASSAVGSSAAGSKAGVSSSVTGGGSSSLAGSSKAGDSSKAGASKAAVSPASSKGGASSPGAAASSKALSPKTNAAGTSKGPSKATSPAAGISKASTSKASSVVDSKASSAANSKVNSKV